MQKSKATKAGGASKPCPAGTSVNHFDSRKFSKMAKFDESKMIFCVRPARLVPLWVIIVFFACAARGKQRK
ncbi:hypothetical protein [Marinoscillum sp.]|uniref:hypothetical protein n=1 Tax=Marinoscillum sp. TaxID=2024838 RepID=UPI003BA8742E